ncbi:hypothetical protein [Reichenbachiella versicolor]|uniref:hypothetical protein n=1 Tax=Reichenbachiella versicolor TaxID=1821036 RepID=UPI000D6DEEE9|nr:hypothetical protein [Reichenbachiella versicolor]
MAKKKITKSAIQKGYQNYLLDTSDFPDNVRVFTTYLKITEAEFYEHFGSIDTVESSLWEDYYHKVINVLDKDPEFENMTDREKHLSFLYTLEEVIKSDRSYIQYRLLHKTKNPMPKFLLKTLKVLDKADLNWVKPPSFIPERGQRFASSTYSKVLWKHSISVIYFWAKDNSTDTKDTDAYIEKSTRTLFDLGQIPALDSVLDLGKFFLQKLGFNKVPA